ncbi:hypothetical protein [Amycolatopsis sp. NPDC051128]|uniref:hypothetical protein n=1 Tax=Amycolatopsis sp. NPDC051128 TaxID=3155412 RepID=UPI003442DEE1
MITFQITGDSGFDAEVVVKPRHFLLFERATGVKFSQFEDEVSMATLYQLAHLVMKLLHPKDTPAKLGEFEKTFDVLPLEDAEPPGPTPAAP